MARSDPFDPIAALQALDERSVRYVVVGALGRVILGSDELTDGIDIVPSPREETLRRLALVLDDLEAGLNRKPTLDLHSGSRGAQDRARAGRHPGLRRPPPQRHPRTARPRRPT